MTEAEERHKKAMVLLEYHESKQAYALLRHEAREIADILEGTAQVLREDPTRIDNREGNLPTFKEVFELAEKVRKASEDLGYKADLARQLGFDGI